MRRHLNPTVICVAGKLKIAGSMGHAMKLGGLLAKAQEAAKAAPAAAPAAPAAAPAAPAAAAPGMLFG